MVVVDEVDEMAVAVVVSFLLIVCGNCDQMIGWLKGGAVVLRWNDGVSLYSLRVRWGGRA